ncbi:MAG: hypothetical protein ACYS80_00515 [Planctomycetota bacterium]
MIRLSAAATHTGAKAHAGNFDLRLAERYEFVRIVPGRLLLLRCCKFAPQ